MGTLTQLPRPLRMGKMGKKSPPTRVKNAEVRSREYLTAQEVAALIAAAGKVGRNGHRDATLILMTFRHGLRVSEVVSMRRDQADLAGTRLHVNRLKGSLPSVHELPGDELRALRKLYRESPESPFIFSSERKAPLTPATVRKLVARAGKLARIPFPVHPHQLRHACGYVLANKGMNTRSLQDYLGNAQIQNTVRYTQLASNRFKGLWD